MAHSKLRKLSILSGNVTPAGLSQVLQHERILDLECLSLAGCQGCDDDAALHVTRFSPKLIALDLSETDITGVGVKYALELKHLQKLIVNNCRKIGPDAIQWARSQGIQVEYRMLDHLGGGKKVRY